MKQCEGELGRRQRINDDGGPEGTETEWENITGSKNKEPTVSFAPWASFLLGHN